MRKLLSLKDERTIPFTDAQLKRMVEMYEGGATSYEVGDVFGISPTATLRRLHALGAKLRKRGRR